jgi:hypothetical protein
LASAAGPSLAAKRGTIKGKRCNSPTQHAQPRPTTPGTACLNHGSL